MGLGRPTVIDATVVSKLETAFADGYTVRQACVASGISHEAFYKRMRIDMLFADKMHYAQHSIELDAKKVVYDAIKKGDLKTAQWLLQQRGFSEPQSHDIDEFGMRQELNDQILVDQKVVDALKRLSVEDGTADFDTTTGWFKYEDKTPLTF